MTSQDICNKPSLYDTYRTHGDIRELIDLLHQYDYTEVEASEVMNMYEPDTEGRIPEVEHTEVILSFFPTCYISPQTTEAIQRSFPARWKAMQALITPIHSS